MAGAAVLTENTLIESGEENLARFGALAQQASTMAFDHQGSMESLKRTTERVREMLSQMELHLTAAEQVAKNGIKLASSS